MAKKYELSGMPLTKPQEDLLKKIAKFLKNIIKLGILKIARDNGYDNNENNFGRENYTIANGSDRPLEHFYVADEDLPQEQEKYYLILDQFENVWFTRARNGIRRFVHQDHRKAFEEAFFANMTQQPKGPLILGSIEKFMTRLKSMKTSDIPGAQDAYNGLVKKGLTEEYLQMITDTLNSIKSDLLIPEEDAELAEEVAQANARQLEAFEKLKLWYIDWADTLRSQLGYHDRKRLGLVSVKKKSKEKPE